MGASAKRRVVINKDDKLNHLSTLFKTVRLRSSDIPCLAIGSSNKK